MRHIVVAELAEPIVGAGVDEEESPIAVAVVAAEEADRPIVGSVAGDIGCLCRMPGLAGLVVEDTVLGSGADIGLHCTVHDWVVDPVGEGIGRLNTVPDYSRPTEVADPDDSLGLDNLVVVVVVVVDAVADDVHQAERYTPLL